MRGSLPERFLGIRNLGRSLPRKCVIKLRNGINVFRNDQPKTPEACQKSRLKMQKG